MLTSIRLQGFRCFSSFLLSPLSRVNLLVGKNNSGKTAALEAIEALVSLDSAQLLYRASYERGEARGNIASPHEGGIHIDIRHWFFGHDLVQGARFQISGEGSRSFDLSRSLVAGPTAPSQPASTAGAALMITLERSALPFSLPALPVTADGYLGAGAPMEWFRLALRLRPRVFFLSTRMLSSLQLQLIWSEIVLTPAEELLVRALRVIDPRVERLAPAGGAENQQFLVLLKGSKGPVPLGTLGEGISRMLAIAMGLVIARGGFLLVDEIEVGIHHSVQTDLWRLVLQTASDLDIQVFATTHSKDCLEAIAALHTTDPSLAAGLAVHRLEAGAEESVRMDSRVIAGTLDGGIDVR